MYHLVNVKSKDHRCQNSTFSNNIGKFNVYKTVARVTKLCKNTICYLRALEYYL